MAKTPKPTSAHARGISRYAPDFFGREPSGVADLVDTTLTGRGANEKAVRSYSRKAGTRKPRAR